MPSFDAVSEVDHHELSNAINQANQEISRRFDLKDTQAKVELTDNTIKILGDDEFQTDQVEKIVHNRLIARIDIKSLEDKGVESNLSQTTKTLEVKEGISSEDGKKINKMIKEHKIKAQSSIMDAKSSHHCKEKR